jgi:hypothetical protein
VHLQPARKRCLPMAAMPRVGCAPAGSRSSALNCRGLSITTSSSRTHSTPCMPVAAPRGTADQILSTAAASRSFSARSCRIIWCSAALTWICFCWSSEVVRRRIRARIELRETFVHGTARRHRPSQTARQKSVARRPGTAHLLHGALFRDGARIALPQAPVTGTLLRCQGRAAHVCTADL